VHARRELARRLEAGALDSAAPPPSRRPEPVVRRRALAAVAVLVALAAGFFAYGQRNVGVPVATTGLQLIAVSSGTQQPSAYELAVLTRADLIRTYATVVADTAQDADLTGGLTVSVTNQPPSGLISIAVTGPDAGTDRRVAEALRDRSVQQLNALGGLFGARAVAQTSLGSSAPALPAGPLAAVALAGAVGVVGWLLVRRRTAPDQAVDEPGRRSEAAAAAASTA
jgi:hypothetical protein